MQDRPPSRPIAFLLPDMRSGGAERVALRLIRNFIDEGCPIDLVLMKREGELLGQLPSGVHVVDLEAGRIRDVIIPLIRYLRARRPRAIQVRMWPLTVAAIIARLLSRVPARVVVSDHVTLSNQYGGGTAASAALRLTTRLLYPLADARVCVSEGVADDLSGLSGLPRTMFNIIYNPVEPPEKIETNHAVEMQWGGQSPRVLSVGTLKDQKNHKVLLDAFAKLPNRSARLIIVGEGPLRGELKRHASQLGIADRLIMPGSVDPWPYYASANLFVLSSDYEGFGNVIVEAMYAGLPVVSTDCPSGPAEILGGGKYGRLVPVGDVGRLSEAIEQALTDAPDPDANRARAKELSGESAVRAYRDLLVDPKVHSQ